MSAWAYAGHLGNKLYKGHYYALSSNGAASKAYPEGHQQWQYGSGNRRYGGDHDGIPRRPAHSISGACAVVAVSEAMRDGTSVYRIIKRRPLRQCKGEELARAREDIWVYPGPSVESVLNGG